MHINTNRHTIFYAVSQFIKTFAVCEQLISVIKLLNGTRIVLAEFRLALLSFIGFPTRPEGPDYDMQQLHQNFN